MSYELDKNRLRRIGWTYIALIILAFSVGLMLTSILSGCASMKAPITVPQTQQETIYSLRVQFAGVVQSASDMRQAGAVSDDLYVRLDSVFNKIRSGLALADIALLQGVSADDQINSILQLMLEVRQLLGQDVK